MPKLADEMMSFQVGQFAFTGAGLEKVANYSTQQTLATIMVDLSGSMGGFEDQVKKMLVLSVKSLKKLDYRDSIMLRVVYFSSRDSYSSGIREVHGFTPIMDIDEDTAYFDIKAAGGTPLNDVWTSSVAATISYGETLGNNEFLVNGIEICITDGCESGASRSTESDIKSANLEATTSEKLESNISILVGINSDNCDRELEMFKNNAGIDHYLKAGDVNDKTIARLVGYISASVSSQSQAVGSGSPSQAVNNLTI